MPPRPGMLHEALAAHWRSTLGTEFPLTREQVGEIITRNGNVLRDAVANPAATPDDVIARLGTEIALSVVTAFSLATLEPIWKDRDPEFRGKCGTFILSAAQVGDAVAKEFHS